MSMWRFEASILLGAAAVPLWFLGLVSVEKAIQDKNKRAGNFLSVRNGGWLSGRLIDTYHAILSGKMGISKRKVFLNPIVTILLAILMAYIPFYSLNAVTGGMESFGHFLMCLVIFKYYNSLCRQHQRQQNGD